MICVEGLSYSVGKFRLGPVDLAVPRGEYFVLLGPPGSGKSLFLECLAGLKRVEAGRVSINDRDVTGVTPRSRAVGYVPQDYALFPHLTVRRNIGFGLEAHGRGKSEARARTREMAEKLAISHLLDRTVRGLSGGEMQRVALARALVLEPEVLLLDEPVSALDESTRHEVCFEIRRFQKLSGVTTIHVSHNLEEAFDLAERAGVLHEGRFRQVGTISDLLRRPATGFVARFMRCGNILKGLAECDGPSSGTTSVTVGPIRIVVDGRWKGPVQLVVRPESVRLINPPADREPEENELPVKPLHVADRGSSLRVELAGPVNLTAHLSFSRMSEIEGARNGELVAVLPREQIHVIKETVQ